VRLSVVVTIVDGGTALVRCLRALATQVEPPEMQVIVPWDATVEGMVAVSREFPSFEFLAMGDVPTSSSPKSPAGLHELFDRRRAAALAAATGEIVAMIEDRGVPRPDWARALVAAHERLPHAVVGGAIDNGVDSAWAWAVYFCDFSRYQPPFEAGPRSYVSDVNIGYKRRALEQTADLWRQRYHETTVHWALARVGEVLYLTPEFAVDEHRTGLTTWPLLQERFAWGRLFAYTRARELSVLPRLALAAAAPLLPLLLFARHARLQVVRRRTLGRFVRVSPRVFVLLVSWSWGEVAGYLTATPD
jgi:hypothetical protein